MAISKETALAFKGYEVGVEYYTVYNDPYYSRGFLKVVSDTEIVIMFEGKMMAIPLAQIIKLKTLEAHNGSGYT